MLTKHPELRSFLPGIQGIKEKEKGGIQNPIVAGKSKMFGLGETSRKDNNWRPR